MISKLELADINGIGKSRLTKLKQLKINSVEDLIHFYPRKYEDYSVITEINKLKPGKVSLKVKIIQVKGFYTRRRLHITEAIASDKSGSVRLIWFNQPYRQDTINKEKEYYISGIFGLSAGRLSIINPSI
ncbi:MAG TPA: hypothetical protein VLF63_03185, partial [Patescibacteria group bacterium]|nr:hypothetical protein [Patescibacteria group bacterium]